MSLHFFVVIRDYVELNFTIMNVFLNICKQWHFCTENELFHESKMVSLRSYWKYSEIIAFLPHLVDMQQLYDMMSRHYGRRHIQDRCLEGSVIRLKIQKLTMSCSRSLSLSLLKCLRKSDMLIAGSWSRTTAKIPRHVC